MIRKKVVLSIFVLFVMCMVVFAADITGTWTASFETQVGVPNIAGTIPTGSVVTFSLWVQKSANFGTIYPRAKLTLNTAAGTSKRSSSGRTTVRLSA